MDSYYYEKIMVMIHFTEKQEQTKANNK